MLADNDGQVSWGIYRTTNRAFNRVPAARVEPWCACRAFAVDGNDSLREDVNGAKEKRRSVYSGRHSFGRRTALRHAATLGDDHGRLCVCPIEIDELINNK